MDDQDDFLSQLERPAGQVGQGKPEQKPRPLSPQRQRSPSSAAPPKRKPDGPSTPPVSPDVALSFPGQSASVRPAPLEGPKPATSTDPEADAENRAARPTEPNRRSKLTLSQDIDPDPEGLPLEVSLARPTHSYPLPDRGPSDTQEAQTARLERQTQELRKHLKAAQEKLSKATQRGQKRALFASGLAMVAGIALGALIGTRDTAVPELVLLAPAGGTAPAPKTQNQPSQNPTEVQDARAMLDLAQEALRRKDLAQAENHLAFCIRLANLPNCHKMMGTLFALTRDPRARQHFEQYLELAPDSDDKARIRAAFP